MNCCNGSGWGKSVGMPGDISRYQNLAVYGVKVCVIDALKIVRGFSGACAWVRLPRIGLRGA